MITLTDTAASKVRDLLDGEGAEELALRVAVRPGGCSGFSYEMFFDGDIASDDEEAMFGQDLREVRVVVDPASAQLLVGATPTRSYMCTAVVRPCHERAGGDACSPTATPRIHNFFLFGITKI